MNTFTQKSLRAGQFILSSRSLQSRKTTGQFLTPTQLARFMQEQLNPIIDGDAILDPAMGSGVLLCAMIDSLIEAGKPLQITIHGFEIDKVLYTTAQNILRDAVEEARKHDILIHIELFHTDFVLNGLQLLRPSLLNTPVGQRYYQHIIANPPYFKINAQDVRRQAAEGLLTGYTNIYTLFMELSVYLLDKNGQACFIVPRSFCSGAYFVQFRRIFIEHTSIQRIHLFDKRDTLFNYDDILQENLVIVFGHNENKIRPSIEISSSASLETLDETIHRHQVSVQQFVSPLGMFRLPMSESDNALMTTVDNWPDRLETYGMAISTGPVVPYRVKTHLTDSPIAGLSVPLLWMQHIRQGQVTWPLENFHKPQYIATQSSLLVENTNYVLLRRFSAKEQSHRLIAAPYTASMYPFRQIGLENHLNYIHKKGHLMTLAESIGLSALLNSKLIDRYVRISSGHTQINATELRALPLPPVAIVHDIGEWIMTHSPSNIDAVIIRHLDKNGLIPKNFPEMSTA